MSTATIEIILPTTRTDGSPLAPSDIASTSIFDDASPGAPIGTVTGAGTSFTTGVLTVGSHNFTASVTDTTGHVSALSNTVGVTVAPTLANPSPPTISVTLNP